ncbi:hypothetical protein I7I50_11220 [Histoplasma capsulatum G186AR]|uniref:Uncharacterized protein n=1 Tax=Ajellomyces capsulatus TaxID=5037 RepID=A0A8H8D782_AJECA|nr:hypothetical protein I7I52_02458 [Histoplasma capsulatum]QSS69800.1 hypothetical protein I7I50_11220 [Histoplasma capsulatum G186AR]
MGRRHHATLPSLSEALAQPLNSRLRMAPSRPLWLMGTGPNLIEDAPTGFGYFEDPIFASKKRNG